jgi:predicted PurR-regulated permease PerM
LEGDEMRQESVNKLTVLLLVTGVSVIFTVMVRGYLMTLLLAGVFSSLSQPIFRRFLKWTRDRRALSSALTLAMILLIVIIPLAIILSIVVAQAVQVGQAVGPWIQQTLSQAGAHYPTVWRICPSASIFWIIRMISSPESEIWSAA